MSAQPPKRSLLRSIDPVLGLFALLAATLGLGSWPAAQAQVPPSVDTRPDPFAKLATLDARRMASTWSSLPGGEGCLDVDRQLAGHAALLLPAPDDDQDARSGAPGPFSLIQPRHLFQLDATGQLGCVFAQVALQRQWVQGKEQWTWDGSALSWRIDPHWRVGAGRIARQWGPGWDGSLILGTDAQPVPSVSLDADTGSLRHSEWWWWLGQLQFSGFLGQMESDRSDISRPWLMGLRLVIKPWEWLELGLSRTMQIGGEGRDNSLKTFIKAILSRDNSCYQPGCSEQPGNQLAGVDLRLGLDRWLPGAAVYGQLIGEDNRPSQVPFPAKNMYMAGAEWRRDGGLAFVEWTDSTAKSAGIAYNHFLYTDGYRYKGQPLGYWADGDSNVWAVGGLLPQVLGGQALAVLHYGALNEAGANPSWPNSRLSSASLQWRTIFDRAFGLTLALDHIKVSATGASVIEGWRDTQLRVQFDAWLY